MFLYGVTLVGFGVTFLVTLTYGILAPWYKSDTGRSFFTLLAALSLLLINSALRIIFSKADWTTYVGLILFAIYTLAMVFIGWHVINAQVLYYLKNKKRKQNG